MTSHIITETGTRTVSDDEFFRFVFGREPRSAAEKARDAELNQAWVDHEHASAKAPKGRAAYWERARYDDEQRGIYAARVREIYQRYEETLTEVHSDPMLKKRRAAA